ncbi:GL18117 [Drosophila persimilis]|uniref:GL18117 n=1 Tax=Drosophila persimilis TaxID=7234 RepID=B4HC17_DROPE|nr:GL18117 [Drosophila persimilis]
MAEHVEYLDDPDKSENDTKVYRSLVLSAPSVHIGLPSNASCALMVNHGPFADPRNYHADTCDLYVSLVKLHLDKELQLDESAKLNSHFRVSDNGLRLFRDYYSTILNNPWTLSRQYSVVLGQSQCLTIVKYKSLNGITLEDLKAFAQKIPQEL